MVRMNFNQFASAETELYQFYAIHGRNASDKDVFLVVGNKFDALPVTPIPVISLTDILHTFHLYDPDTPVKKVCEDYGIIPDTATYFNDYKDFVIYVSNAEED